MKKAYMKPRISVESLCLDQPIAANCTADYDDMQALISFGYFNPDHTCDMHILDDGMIDWDKDGVADDRHDTVCYHSNVQTAFLS